MTETATVTVEAVAGVKEGTNAKGKAWKKWAFKASDGNWYSTFTEGLGTRFVKGESYTIEYTEDDYGRTVKAVKSADTTTANHDRSSLDTRIPGFTGGEKDRSIVRQVAWKAAVELIKVAKPLSDTAKFFTTAEAFKEAAKIAHGIENDIYREQPKPAIAPEGPGDSDIPFQPTI